MKYLRWASGFGAVAGGLILAALISSITEASGFKPPCQLPFDSLKVKHPIDEDCAAVGSATSESQKDQNRAKNNFCASGVPIRVTYLTFQRLQERTEEREVPFGSSNRLPEDRSILQGIYTTSDGASIGEGTVVRFAAYVLDAHYSNVGKGESVNCKERGEENNDVHIALARSPDEEDLCQSVTAEISPHYRPLSWDPVNLSQLEHHPVRVTGQLFFDGSHKPCVNGRGSPRRVSVWEIHPIYAIDVCRNRSLESCNANDDSKWVPLEQWLNLEDEEE